MRTKIKIEARDAMKDRKLAEKLDKEEKPKSFEQLLAGKISRGLTKQEALKDIIRSSATTRISVDNE